jgi:hypothetical protein
MEWQKTYNTPAPHASLVLSMANKPPQSPCDNMCPWQCV